MVNGVSLYKSFLDAYDKKVEEQKRVEDQKSSKKEVGSQPDKKDVISISSEAQTLSKIKSLTEDVSDIRKEKVLELKARIRSGEYQPSPDGIASKLIDEFV